MKKVLILIHGLHGTEHDFDYFGHLLDKTDIHFYVSKSNGFLKTYDGLPVMARRLLEEVLTYLNQLAAAYPKDSQDKMEIHLSILGHSLGGLISWYFIRLLMQQDDSDLDQPLKLRKAAILQCIKITPVGFYTVCSPLLGTRRAHSRPPSRSISSSLPSDRDAQPSPSSSQDDPLNECHDRSQPCWTQLIPCLANRIGPHLFGSSGRELFVKDKDRLLVQYMQPKGEYQKVLKEFRVRCTVGLTGDFIVPISSAIMLHVDQSEVDKWIRQRSGSMNGKRIDNSGFRLVYQSGFDPDHPLYDHELSENNKQSGPVDVVLVDSKWANSATFHQHQVDLDMDHHELVNASTVQNPWRRVVFDFYQSSETGLYDGIDLDDIGVAASAFMDDEAGGGQRGSAEREWEFRQQVLFHSIVIGKRMERLQHAISGTGEKMDQAGVYKRVVECAAKSCEWLVQNILADFRHLESDHQ